MRKRSILLLASTASVAGIVLLPRRRMSLVNKVVVITGGSRGLGLEIARSCLALGARVVLLARRQDELDRAKGALLAAGFGSVEVRKCDVRDASSTTEVLQSIDRIDVLINNAGIITVGPAINFTLEDYVDVMQTNYFGALHATLAVLPQMLERRAGSIVNVASIGGKVPFPHLLPYVASKHALMGWSNGLRTELAPWGIRVTTVNPAVMATGSHMQALFKGDKKKEYRWFAAAATLPFTAVNVKTAAQHIVNALVKGSGEVEVGLSAVIAARFSGISHTLTEAALSTANALLPRSKIGNQTAEKGQFLK